MGKKIPDAPLKSRSEFGGHPKKDHSANLFFPLDLRGRKRENSEARGGSNFRIRERKRKVGQGKYAGTIEKRKGCVEVGTCQRLGDADLVQK